MPSPTETLFANLSRFKFPLVLEALKQNPELINAINPKTQNSLLKSVVLQSRSPELSQYIATHPQLNLHYKDSKETNIAFLIRLGCADIFALLANNPEVIYDEKELTYKKALADLQNHTTQLNNAKQSNSPCLDILQTHQARLELTVSHLRDITILHAIKHDDRTIMEQMKNCGAMPTKPLGALGNKEIPTFLVKQEHVQIRGWFKEQLRESTTKLSESTHTLMNSIKKQKELENQLQTINKNYATRNAQIDKKRTDGLMEVLQETTRTLKI